MAGPSENSEYDFKNIAEIVYKDQEDVEPQIPEFSVPDNNALPKLSKMAEELETIDEGTPFSTKPPMLSDFKGLFETLENYPANVKKPKKPEHCGACSTTDDTPSTSRGCLARKKIAQRKAEPKENPESTKKPSSDSEDDVPSLLRDLQRMCNEHGWDKQSENNDLDASIAELNAVRKAQDEKRELLQGNMTNFMLTTKEMEEKFRQLNSLVDQLMKDAKPERPKAAFTPTDSSALRRFLASMNHTSALLNSNIDWFRADVSGKNEYNDLLKILLRPHYGLELESYLLN